MTKATYDIVIVTDIGETHTYGKRTSETILPILEAMDEDRVFGLLDDEMRLVFFKPNQVSKIQINLRESWVRR